MELSTTKMDKAAYIRQQQQQQPGSRKEEEVGQENLVVAVVEHGLVGGPHPS